VTDIDGQPLPGVTIVVKGTTIGTVSSGNGSYTLTKVPENASLVFSFVGMRTAETEIGNRGTIDLKMEPDVLGIDEVIAIGYGTQRRENVTGSVATAGTDKIEGEPVTTVAQALQGDISGVTIR